MQITIQVCQESACADACTALLRHVVPAPSRAASAPSTAASCVASLGVCPAQMLCQRLLQQLRLPLDWHLGALPAHRDEERVYGLQSLYHTKRSVAAHYAGKRSGKSYLLLPSLCMRMHTLCLSSLPYTHTQTRKGHVLLVPT